MLCVWKVWLSQSQPRGKAGSRVSTLRATTIILGSIRQQVTGKRSPESASGQPGSVTTHSPAILVGLPLQFDRSPTSGPIWTRTPDGPQTSTDIVDDKHDVDLTEVKIKNLPFSFVLVTASATIDVAAVDSAAADATITAPYLTRFLATLNMLPHVVAEGMAPNITVTVHSVQTPMMLDSGAQISVFYQATLLLILIRSSRFLVSLEKSGLLAIIRLRCEVLFPSNFSYVVSVSAIRSTSSMPPLQ